MVETLQILKDSEDSQSYWKLWFLKGLILNLKHMGTLFSTYCFIFLFVSFYIIVPIISSFEFGLFLVCLVELSLKCVSFKTAHLRPITGTGVRDGDKI